MIDPPKRSASSLAKFNVTQDEFAGMWVAQCGRCYLCTKAFTRDSRRPAAIDHDHKTGMVRGLLCKQCNFKLGWLHEAIEWFRNAVAYLTNPPATRTIGERYVQHAPPRKETV